MVTPVNNFRVVKPFMPTLSHLALVKVAIALYNDFGVETLEAVFTDIQHGNSQACEQEKQKNQEMNYKRAKKSLLFIPPHLRKSVLRAIHGLQFAVSHWQIHHTRSLQLKDGEYTILWRCDGTVDTIKTFEKLVLDKNIDIRKRFEIACMQCLEKQLPILWKEMNTSGTARNFKANRNSVMDFWIRWMRDGSKVPWTQAAREYLAPPRETHGTLIPRFSSLFPFLQMADRRKFLKFLQYTPLDDLRFCLYAVTKEEEDKILKLDPSSILHLYLNWPLQSLFMETAERMWTYIDASSFCRLVFFILRIKIIEKDFDYNRLFVEFWSRSPNHFKEQAEQCPVLSKKIDSYFNEIRRKRKADKDEQTNSKKKVLCSQRKQNKWSRKKLNLLSSSPRTKKM
ncbi:hypothetical protein HNY73_004595 [Argiope bruennichi]|uniref:Uncharacterized protein n=1 Tax=Argiope bruennichi TaxID=94029 RepID=A0A8T0FPF2_ARGBR|nr:hypothetical protein HNY73_004595 [Argiope bruennichi]